MIHINAALISYLYVICHNIQLDTKGICFSDVTDGP